MAKEGIGENTPIFNDGNIIGALVTLNTSVGDVKTAVGDVETAVGDVETAVGDVETAVKLLRWGVAREPVWYGGVSATPGAGAVLATQTVTAALVGRCFGIIISSPFADVFTLNDDAGMVLTFNVGANAQVFIVSPIEIAGGFAAASVITIKCVAGGAGDVLAKFLYDEG